MGAVHKAQHVGKTLFSIQNLDAYARIETIKISFV
jgi:hypothetical protein